jgi:hypothetical protein
MKWKGRQNEHKTSKYQNSQYFFNIFFLSITEKINHILNIVVGKTTALMIQNITYQKYLINPLPM